MPDVRSVKSRVTPASTVMPSKTIVVQPAFPDLAADADVKVQALVAESELELEALFEELLVAVDSPAAEVEAVLAFLFDNLGIGVAETRAAAPRTSPTVFSN